MSSSPSAGVREEEVISGANGALDGIKAVKKTMKAGKVVKYALESTKYGPEEAAVITTETANKIIGKSRVGAVTGGALGETAVVAVGAADFVKASKLEGAARDQQNKLLIKHMIQGTDMVAGGAMVGSMGAKFGAGLGEALFPEGGPVGPIAGAFVFGSLGGTAGAAIFSGPGKEMTNAFLDTKAGDWSIHQLGEAETKYNILKADIQKTNLTNPAAQHLNTIVQWKEHVDAYGAALASGDRDKAENARAEYQEYLARLASSGRNGGQALLSRDEYATLDHFSRDSFDSFYHDRKVDSVQFAQTARQAGQIFQDKFDTAQIQYAQTQQNKTSLMAQARKPLSPSMTN